MLFGVCDTWGALKERGCHVRITHDEKEQPLTLTEKVFVCWDKDFVPSAASQAASYHGARKPPFFKPITDDDRLVYFAKHNSASLDRAENLYLDWARVTGLMSPQCQELNRMFSTCVDGNRIKIPPKLSCPHCYVVVCDCPQPPLCFYFRLLSRSTWWPWEALGHTCLSSRFVDIMLHLIS